MKECEIIAIADQKGGVGKTTTTINLGIALAKQGNKVLLIDADPQGDLTTSLGYNGDSFPHTLSAMMQSVIDDKPYMTELALVSNDEEVDLIPSNLDLSAVDMQLVTAFSWESVMKTCLAPIKPHYVYILIDCMPSLDILTIHFLTAAESVIIPTQAQY